MLRALVEGVGSIAAQAYLNPTYRDRAKQLMQLGYSPSAIIAQLEIEDANHQWRQYGIVDLQGRYAAFTGSNADAEKGHRPGVIGDFIYSVQGNILVSQQVLIDMENAFRNTAGELAERLIASLEAGDAAGGDSRCTSYGKTALSSFVTVLRLGDGGSPYLDLEIPSTPASPGSSDPIDLLRTDYDQWMTDMAAEPDAYLSTITAPALLPPDGVSTGTVTVTVRNRESQPITGLTVTLSNTGAGSLGTVTDNADGTYTATLTAPPASGTDEISAQVQGPTRTVDLDQTATVTYGYPAPPKKKKSGCSVCTAAADGWWTVLAALGIIAGAYALRRKGSPAR